MEAIKCPNCGSEKVQELTEEKYVCLACDNVFLVHNLSKEFRMTDEHISGVHEDLSKKIDELSKSVESATINVDGSNVRAKDILFEAEEALSRGELSTAYTEFKRYTTFVSDSYVGYEGMFRALTNNYNNYVGMKKELDCLLDATDLLRKALTCEDCPKEDVLNKYKAYYTKFAQIITYVSPEELAREKERKEVLFNNMTQNLSKEMQKLEELQNDYKYKSDDVDNYENMSVEEYKKVKMRVLRRTIILLIITILLWNSLHIIFKILLVVVLLIFVSGLFSNQSKDVTTRKKELEEAVSELEKQKKNVETIKNTLNELETEMNREPEEQIAITTGYLEKLIMDVGESINIADIVSKKYLQNTQSYKENNMDNSQVRYEYDFENQHYVVELTEASMDVYIIKTVREMFNLGLSEAKELIGKAPVVLVNDANKEEAEDIKKRLEEAGAIVTVKSTLC